MLDSFSEKQRVILSIILNRLFSVAITLTKIVPLSKKKLTLGHFNKPFPLLALKRYFTVLNFQNQIFKNE